MNLFKGIGISIIPIPWIQTDKNRINSPFCKGELGGFRGFKGESP